MLLQVIGQLIPLAVGVAVSPVAVVAAILLLLAPRGRLAGVAYVAGWVVGLAAVVTVVLAVEGALGVGAAGGSGRIASILLLAVGFALLAFAWRMWRGRPAPGETEPTPRWMQAFDSTTPLRALGLGVLLAGVKPKNLALSLAAATAIAEAPLSTAEAVASAAVYIGLGSVSIAAPLLAALALGDRAGPVLTGWKDFLVARNATIMTVLLLVFGAVLIGNGLASLG